MAPATLTAAEPRVIRPQAGPQERFLASPADIAIAGGGAGGGKSWALLFEPIRHVANPKFGAVLFRREYPRITQEGGLWDESAELYPLVGGQPRESPTKEWRFPSGATVAFHHLQHEKSKYGWAGAQLPFLGFDQLEEFSEGQFWFLCSRLRSMSGVRPYVRGTCNPVPERDPIGGWLHRLLQWWIDPATGYALPERSGVLRWFVRRGDVLVWDDTPEALIARFPGPDTLPKSLTFIPMRLSDNAILLEKNPGYRAELLALPLVERERLLSGNWNITPTAGLVFNRGWFDPLAAAPADVVARVRYWDKAASAGTGDYSAGVRMTRTREGLYIVEDVLRGQWSSLDRERVILQAAKTDPAGTAVWVEQEPGSGGKESAELTVRSLAGYPIRADKVHDSKLRRVAPLAAQAEARNVKVVAAAWTPAFLDELHAFDGLDRAFDDQVTAAAGAFAKLALGVGGAALIPIRGF